MKKAVSIIAVVFVFLFSGCSDYNELNMQELVKSAGVDLSDGAVRVSIVCNGEEEKREIKEASGKSFFEAVRQMSGKEGKKLYWGHVESLIFGEEALSKTFSQTLDALLRARDVYLDVIPVAVRGKAVDALSPENMAVFESFSNEENSRRFKAYPLWELLRARELFGVCIIPTVQKTENGLAMEGGAVLSEKGVSGYLSGEEMLLCSLLTDKGAGGYLPTIDAGEELAVSFEILANDIKVKKQSDNFIILQKLTLSPAEVRGEISSENMKKAAEKYLSNGYDRLISRAKREKLGNILMLSGAKEKTQVQTSTQVTISNVLGGK